MTTIFLKTSTFSLPYFLLPKIHVPQMCPICAKTCFLSGCGMFKNNEN